MTYDGLDRLKSVTSTMFGNAAYTYDVLDNLTRATVGATSNLAARDHFYCYDSKWQLTNVKTGGCNGATVIGLSYDVQGNLANKSGTAHAFDYGNRLRSVSYASGLVESYRYDGHGRRVWSNNGGLLQSMYSNAGELLYQRNERTGKATDYIMLNGDIVASVERPLTGGTGTVKYQHTDALGSPVAVTNASRTIIETSEYEPFGRVGNRAVRDGAGYTGHAEDAATGLTYMQQRYYDPTIARYMSVDPVTAEGGDMRHFNRYAYVYNNPYKFFDPDGRAGCTGTRITSVCDSGGVAAMQTSGLSYGVARATSRGERVVNTVKGYIDSQAAIGRGGQKVAHFFADDAIDALGNIADGRLSSAGQNIAMALVGKKAGLISDVFSRAPKGLMDQMVLDAAKQGQGILILRNLIDPRFRGMEKWSYGERSKHGQLSEVHCVRDPRTGELMDFKFKQHSDTGR